MSAPMPERVKRYDLVQRGEWDHYGEMERNDEYGDYVTFEDYEALESRLLAAEARVREVEAELRIKKRQLSDMEDRAFTCERVLAPVIEERNENGAEARALRAERDALVPLARFGLAALNDNMENYGPSAELDHAASFGVFTRITHNDGGVSWDDTPATTQARAILARAVGA